MKKISLVILPFFLLASEENSFESTLQALIQQFQGASTKEKDFTITHHSIELNGEELSYNAVTGTLDQHLDNGEICGELFFTAYLKEKEGEERPVTFIFNGGPGGAALAMHIGGMAPRRLLLPEEGQKRLPPYQIIDNPESIFNQSDIVLIDPVGTGYSQAQNDIYKQAYYGVESDLFSFTEFIRMFCIHFNRWNSPKYLAGASYGTARACGLAESLLSYGIHLNGIILMSCALDYSTFNGSRDAPLANCLLIPSLAATAWYHGRTSPELTVEQVVEHARKFAFEQYVPFMMQPHRMSPIEQQTFYQKFSELIGLPASTIARYGARIDEPIYVTEFFNPERKILGGVDSRFIGDVSSIAPDYSEDPSYGDFRPSIYPAFMNYMQNELETKSDFPKYISFNQEAIQSWNWRTFDNPYSLPNFMQRLRRTLIVNPAMKVFVGSGYYDIRTPFGAAEYSLAHLELPETYRKNFQIEYYKAGHAFIFDLASLKKFKVDLTKFYEQ